MPNDIFNNLYKKRLDELSNFELTMLKRIVDNIIELEKKEFYSDCVLTYAFCKKSAIMNDMAEDIYQYFGSVYRSASRGYNSAKASDGARKYLEAVLVHPIYRRHLETFLNPEKDENKDKIFIIMNMLGSLMEKLDEDELYEMYADLLKYKPKAKPKKNKSDSHIHQSNDEQEESTPDERANLEKIYFEDYLMQIEDFARASVMYKEINIHSTIAKMLTAFDMKQKKIKYDISIIR